MSNGLKRAAKCLFDTEDLECTICCELFDSNDRIPRSLHCGHHFCALCLTGLIRKPARKWLVQCPVCEVETSVPGQDVSKLPKNFAVSSMVEKAGRQSVIQHESETPASSPATSSALSYSSISSSLNDTAMELLSVRILTA